LPAARFERLRDFIVRERWLLAIGAAALVVRLHWNLVVHPLGDYIYSDMRGYDIRADAALADPWAANEYAAFFPYGTHVLVAMIKLVFGTDNYTAMGVVYALMGACVAALVYAVARRSSKFAAVAPAAGLIAVFYYPLISIGGYILSETPTTMFMMAALLLTLRLVDRGRARDAWLAGLAIGLGMLFRPQLLISAALFFLFWLLLRKHMPRVRRGLLLRALVPIVVLLALSSVRLHHHTGRFGLISENAPLNLVFGRCHVTKVRSKPDDEGHTSVYFRPPSFLQLRQHNQRVPDAWLSLDPVRGNQIEYEGYIGDRGQHMQLVRDCIREHGWVGQAKYSFTHIVLLWQYNTPWPDYGRPEWRDPAVWWMQWHRRFLAVPALLALVVLARPRRLLELSIVALNLVALLILAIVFFGAARHRIPYDPVIIILALETYAFAAYALVRAVQRWLQRRR
jgi:hypothetical protein